MTHGVNRVGWRVYILAYGFPFVVVVLNFGLTIFYFDHQQQPNDPQG